MDETQLTKILGEYRDAERARPAPDEAWRRIELRAARPARRVPPILVGIASVAALAIVAAAILLPTREEHAESRLAAPSGELVYVSLHFQSKVLSSEQIIVLDLGTGRKRVIATGGYCGDARAPGGAPWVPGRHTIAFCGPDANGSNTIWALDLDSGRKARVRTQSGYSPVGWTTNGDLLLLRQEPKPHGVFAWKSGAMRLLFTSDRFVMAASAMSGDVVAIMQSQNSAAQCEKGNCGGNELVVVRDGRIVMKIGDYPSLVTAFDHGNSLLIQTMLRANEQYGAARLEVIRRAGAGFERRRTGLMGVFGDPAVSEDGRIAITDGKSIFVLDHAAMKLHRVTTGMGPLAWSPDGRAIVYAGPDPGNRTVTIRITDLRGRNRALVRGEDVRVVALLR